MDRYLDDIAHAYDKEIQVPGKELAFLILIAFLLSFGFIRTSAHMIKAQVSWWPGNVETKGGTHIHHLVWGILLMTVFGYLGIALAEGSPWEELAAILFGIGMGLTFDEFALWLNLKDVYWSEQGRQSIDAVVVATLLIVITLLGLSLWLELWKAFTTLIGLTARHDEAWTTYVAWHALGLAFGIACAAKGKWMVGILGVVLPPISIVGAIRLAKPRSWWARRRYDEEKRERARVRHRHDDAATPSGPRPQTSAAS